MNCPYCGNASRVIDSRPIPEGIRRRRECLSCKRRFTTTEKTLPEGEVLSGDKFTYGVPSATWDCFICHASEDKEDFVRPLAEILAGKGLRVWYDEFELTIGDSLRRSIDRGLSGSRFGVVIISPSFLEREWPQRELDGLTSREADGRKVILPVWHKVDAAQVRGYSSYLADRIAADSRRGVERVAADLVRAMGLQEKGQRWLWA